MTEEKKYLLITKCTGTEDHDGETWIDEEKFNEIKQKAGKTAEGFCSVCSQIIKDEEGNVILKVEGC